MSLPTSSFSRIREQTRRDAYSLWAGWHLREVRKPSVWAAQDRRIAAGQSPLTHGEDIPYRHEVMPWCVEPMDTADDPTVNVIVLWMARRSGKTEGVCGNIIGRTVTDDPGNIISMWPVEDSSDRFSRDVIEPMIEATPSLTRVFVERKSRDTGRTIDYKRFHGGSLYIINAGSKSKTRGMAAKIVLAHEVDAYPVSSQGEGDPIAKLFGRTEGFEATKIIESTGTFTAEITPDGAKVYRSNIEMWYDRSDQRKWFCPCRKCGHGQWLKFDQIKAVAKKSGALHYYLCETCDAEHDEKQWRRMVGAGQWKPTAPFNGVRGYWINGANSLFPKAKGYTSKLHQFHAENEAAMAAQPEVKKVWVNEMRAELWNPDTEKTPPPPYQPILDGREDYATEAAVLVPEQALVLTSMTDLHADRLEVEWRAWAKDETSWGVGHFVLFGDTNRTEVWDEWTRHQQRTFPHALGVPLRLSLALVDGGWRVDPALAMLQRIANVAVPGVTGKVRISKGAPQWQSVIHNKWGTVKTTAKGIIIGTWAAKSLIYERLRWHGAKEKPPGFMHFGKCYGDEFVRQSVSEVSVFKIINGANVETFKNPEGNRNEALDLLVGNLAAFRRTRWDFETIERTMRDDAEALRTPNANAKPEIDYPIFEGGQTRGSWL
jgi:phage terminase large subunit GpA-like protein